MNPKVDAFLKRQHKWRAEFESCLHCGGPTLISPAHRCPAVGIARDRWHAEERRTREVPLSKGAAASLRDHPRGGEVVFHSAGGVMLTKGESKWPLYRAAQNAGIRRIGWHVLRHTFASHLVMRGVPIRTLQELLGHSSIEMTMRYTHLSPDARREAVELLDN